MKYLLWVSVASHCKSILVPVCWSHAPTITLINCSLSLSQINPSSCYCIISKVKFWMWFACKPLLVCMHTKLRLYNCLSVPFFDTITNFCCLYTNNALRVYKHSKVACIQKMQLFVYTQLCFVDAQLYRRNKKEQTDQKACIHAL